MTTYARVAAGKVAELFTMPPQWSALAITDLFHPDLGEWVDVTSVEPQPAYGWTYDGGNFTPPSTA
jgi:hypothetical protein